MTGSLKLHTLVCSTRPGRLGLGVVPWTRGRARFNDQNRSAAATLLAELHRRAGALKPLRG